MEPWHADINDFLELRKNQGAEELRARDLFLAMWVNDLFMERVSLDGDWCLMCPNESPGLTDVYGDEFRNLYTKYESEGRYKKKVKARDVWDKILESQIETGTPYMLYKDTINERSNQSNIGIVRSSNLCAEIIQITGNTKTQKDILQNKELLDSLGLGHFYGKESVNETAVCNLSSIALPMFINKNKSYNFKKLYDIAYSATVNLNNVIDVNYYPSESARFSNLLHRPIGLGVQGLADVFFKLDLPYDSDEAKKLNKEIFETIYFASISASCDLAKEQGPYTTFKGSPLSEGKFQFDLWGVEPTKRWDWEKLREDVVKFGVRNSLTTAIMPTASCFVINDGVASIDTINGVKSYIEILEDNGIDWRSIEKTNQQQWIKFNEPVEVLTRHGYRTSDKVFYNGHVDIVEIELEDGTILKCSENHKFLVDRNGEQLWVRADELTETDNIVDCVYVAI